MRRRIISIMASIVSVALGCAVGLSTPSASMTSWNAFVYSAATSAAVRPSSLARAMILSSTSVMFCTNLTLNPLNIRYRLMTSKVRKVRALPMWMWL